MPASPPIAVYVTTTEPAEDAEPVADDVQSDDYGIAEHLAAIEQAYAEALAHIAAQAEAWTTALLAADTSVPRVAQNEVPPTGQMAALVGRPSVPVPRAA